MGDFFGRSGSGEGGFESPNLDEIVQDIFQIREGTGRNRHHRHHSNVRSAISSCSSSNTPSSEEEIGSPTTDVRRQSVPFMAREQRPRPQVTLRYVQTLDGSLVASDTEALRIDNPDSMTLINRLRANNDAVLVGINTIERDDPAMTVATTGNAARQPRPVILDTDLRIPLAAKVLRHPKTPWIFTRLGNEDAPRKAELEAMGVKVFFCPLHDDGFLELEEVLERLYLDLGIRRLSVEGGVSVLESFIASGLFDKILIIISPSFGAGHALFQDRTLKKRLPRLVDVRYEVIGNNLIVMAEPDGQRS